MHFYASEAAEVILSERYDANHIEKLRQQISVILKELLGSKLWTRWYFCIGSIARFVYYTVTTLSGVQTLGEENHGLIAVTDTSSVKFLTFRRRLVLVLLLVLQPVLTKLFAFRYLQHYLSPYLNQTAYSVIYHHLWSWIPTLVKKLHLAWFYLFGRQYLLLKGLAGVVYISIRPHSNIQGSKILRILGFLSLYQTLQRIIIESARLVFGICKRPIHRKRLLGKFRCPICFENRPPACTPCGHLFCWYCIIEHCLFSSIVNQEVSSCPHCRFQFSPSRIVPLFNLYQRMNMAVLNFSRSFLQAVFCRFKSSKSCHPAVYFSGIQPTGIPHLGNYFGFIKPWLNIQEKESETAALYLSVADYHSLSSGPVNPTQMKQNIIAMTASLLASGVNPERTCLFQQSSVAEHTNLMFVLGMLQTIPQLKRQAQFKEKSTRFGSGDVPLNLLIYPVLQTADILLYKGTHVPVGEDQTQHLRLSRDLAHHFNSIYKVDYFPIPEQVTTESKRIKSLRDPSKKMSKSDLSSLSRIDLNDSRKDIFDKCLKALSDFQSDITYEVERRPSIANLISIYCALNGKKPDEVVKECAGLDTRGFKNKLAEDLDRELSPVRQRYEELMANEKYVVDVLEEGAEKARKTARNTFNEVKSIIGFSL